VPKKIVGFVLPGRVTAHLDGTTLYLSLASIFVAQLPAEIDSARAYVMISTLNAHQQGASPACRACARSSSSRPR